MKRKRRRSHVGTEAIPRKMKELGFARYADYLKSQHWKELKARFWSSKLIFKVNGKAVCSCCRTKELNLQLHHRTYARLGREYLTDLTLLCDECHHLTHQFNKLEEKSLFNSHRRLRSRLKKVLDKNK